MKKHYWFDKHLLNNLEESKESGGIIASIGTTRRMRANGTLLYKNSMMQDGWDYFPLRLEIDGQPTFRYVCENDFHKLCREYKMYDLGAMMRVLNVLQQTIVVCPHIKQQEDNSQFYDN